MQHTKRYKGYHLATTGNGQDGKPRWQLKQYLGYDTHGKKIALHKIVTGLYITCSRATVCMYDKLKKLVGTMKKPC